MAIFAISRGYGEMGVFPDVWFVLYVGGASYGFLGVPATLSCHI